MATSMQRSLFRLICQTDIQGLRRAYPTLSCTTSSPRKSNNGTLKIDKFRYDQIGPPHPVSNIPPLRLQKVKGETQIEEKYREQRLLIQRWNQEFWEKHNKNFSEEKEMFIKAKMLEQEGNADGEASQSLTTQEMSDFYKEFLDKYHESHMQYNKQWYRKNISLLWPALKVSCIKLLRKLRRSQKNPPD